MSITGRERVSDIGVVVVAIQESYGTVTGKSYGQRTELGSRWRQSPGFECVSRALAFDSDASEVPTYDWNDWKRVQSASAQSCWSL